MPSNEEVAARMGLGSAAAVIAGLQAGADAHSRLVCCNLGLVRKIAGSYTNSCGVAFDDLYQVWCFNLPAFFSMPSQVLTPYFAGFSASNSCMGMGRWV